MPNFGHEIRALSRLALPVVAAQVGVMTMGVVDTIMVGHVSVEALAAAGLGHTWLFAVLLLATGLVLGMDPLVSQAHGAGDPKGATRVLQRAIVLGLLLSIPLAGLWGLTRWVLLWTGQDPVLAEQAHLYVAVQIPSMPFLMVYTALRQYLQGRTIVRPAMWAVAIANVFNLFFNWLLIFGNLGFPALGLLGAGIATSLTRALMLPILLGWALSFGLMKGAWTPWTRDVFRLDGLRQLLRLGLPVGAQMFLEVLAFSAAALMAGRLGTQQLAAHVIVINMASFSFMVPLGIGIGTSTRVGNLIGAGRTSDIMRTCNAGFFMGGAAMLCFATIFVFGRFWLPGFYTPDRAIIELCAWILPIAASFQLFDGVQFVGAGILRGMGRTRAAAIGNAVAYYVLALPLGAWFGLVQGYGLAGIWWGLCLGLAVIASFLVIWVRRHAKAPTALAASL